MIKINEGEHRDLEVKMPEYETLFAIGSMLENNDLQSIFNANHICDELGIDTISFGVTVAFLTECVEKNLFSNDDLEIPLEFGQFSRLPEITRMAALREGRIGELLAMGSQRLAEEIGGNSKNFLYAVKGLEIAGHSARGSAPWALPMQRPPAGEVITMHVPITAPPPKIPASKDFLHILLKAIMPLHWEIPWSCAVFFLNAPRDVKLKKNYSR